MFEKDYRKQSVHKCQEKRQLPLKGLVTTAEESRVIVRVEAAIAGTGPLLHEKVIKPRKLTPQQMHPDIKPAAMDAAIRISPAFWAVIHHLQETCGMDVTAMEYDTVTKIVGPLMKSFQKPPEGWEKPILRRPPGSSPPQIDSVSASSSAEEESEDDAHLLLPLMPPVTNPEAIS